LVGHVILSGNYLFGLERIIVSRVSALGNQFSIPLIVTAILFSASLVAMICAATLSSSLSTFYLSLGIFIGCSAAWVGLQASQANRAPHWFVVGSGIVFLVAGAVLALWHPNSSIRLIGGVLIYLGAGFLVEVMRETQDRIAILRVIGWIFLAVGALFILGEGLTLLNGAGFQSYLLITLVVAALVLVPVGLNVVSEQALALLRGDRGGLFRPWVWILAGLLLSAVAVVVIGVTAHSWLSWLVISSCALALIAALVSNTHADIVMVLCVLALLSVSPAEVSLADASTPGTGTSDLLALGDSYMSGEGARTFLVNTDESGGDTCRRAPTAYAVLAVGPGQAFDHVTFLACSGARTFNVISKSADPAAQVQSGEPGTQVDQVRALGPGYRPKLVIVSLGGNDAGFSTLGETCIAPGNCDTQRALFEDNLPRVRAALVSTYASIRAALPDTPVVVVPYPQPLADESSCNEIALSSSERAFIRQFLAELDQTIASAAGQAGFYYLGTMESALAAEHLQLCDPANDGNPGINFVSLESVNGLAEQRFNPTNWLHDSLHPNERGHQAMLAAFETWLKQHPHLAVHAPSGVTPFRVTPGATKLPDPPCSMTTAVNSCQVLTRNWMLAQILDLWPYFFVVLISLFGLWLISVGTLSWLPRPAAGARDRPPARRPAQPTVTDA
jgi:lysophospholipase L1-like esterase